MTCLLVPASRFRHFRFVIGLTYCLFLCGTFFFFRVIVAANEVILPRYGQIDTIFNHSTNEMIELLTPGPGAVFPGEIHGALFIVDTITQALLVFGIIVPVVSTTILARRMSYDDDASDDQSNNKSENEQPCAFSAAFERHKDALAEVGLDLATLVAIDDNVVRTTSAV